MSTSPVTPPPVDSGVAVDLPAPVIPAEVLNGIPHIGELRELGLGSYATPPGLLQGLIEFCSATTALPWACGIAMTTVILRTALLPVVIKSMRNNVRLSNIQPDIMLLNDRLKACTNSGDKIGAAAVTDKMRKLFEDNNCHPLASFVPVLIQFPVFLSFFFAIRSMTSLPVESLKHGGYLWFTDLTVTDDTYALPLIASCTMALTLELGAEGMKQSKPVLKTVMRVLPFALLPVSASFPAGLFMYWITANVFSLSQVVILRVPALREALDIPAPKDPVITPASKESFVESTRNAYEAYLEKSKMRQKEQEAALRAEALKKMKIPKKPVE